MDTEAVKERLNLHLKRKLVQTPPTSSPLPSPSSDPDVTTSPGTLPLRQQPTTAETSASTSRAGNGLASAAAASHDSVIVPNTAYAANTSPAIPQQPQPAATRSARSSPRKARLGLGANSNGRRTLHSSTESINSLPSSSQSTPAHTPLSRSAAATPTTPLALVGTVYGISNGHQHQHEDDAAGSHQPPGQQLSPTTAQQQPDLLTSVLTAKKLSMMRDPAVVAFLDGIVQRLASNSKISQSSQQQSFD